MQVGLLPSPHLGLTFPSRDPPSREARGPPPWALAETTQAIVTITNFVSVSYIECSLVGLKSKVFIDLNSLLVVIMNVPPTTRNRTIDPIMIVDFFILVQCRKISKMNWIVPNSVPLYTRWFIGS